MPLQPSPCFCSSRVPQIFGEPGIHLPTHEPLGSPWKQQRSLRTTPFLWIPERQVLARGSGAAWELGRRPLGAGGWPAWWARPPGSGDGGGPEKHLNLRPQDPAKSRFCWPGRAHGCAVRAARLPRSEGWRPAPSAPSLARQPSPGAPGVPGTAGEGVQVGTVGKLARPASMGGARPYPTAGPAVRQAAKVCVYARTCTRVCLYVCACCRVVCACCAHARTRVCACVCVCIGVHCCPSRQRRTLSPYWQEGLPEGPWRGDAEGRALLVRSRGWEGTRSHVKIPRGPYPIRSLKLGRGGEWDASSFAF